MRVSGTLIRSLCSDAIRGGEVSGEDKRLTEGEGERRLSVLAISESKKGRVFKTNVITQ